MGERRAVLWDTLAYAGSAAVAVLVALSDRIPLQRTWGRLAFVPYLAAAALSAAVAIACRGWPAWRVRWLRGVALVIAIVGAAVAPLVLEARWRAEDGYRDHVQSEVLVTEGSARALLRGTDPYAASFGRGPLGAWPEGTADHVPYLPAMFLFGLPRGVIGGGWPTDARVAFGVVGLAAVGAAAVLARAAPGRLLTALLIVVALPTGARYMAGGGDDLVVLSLMLLALVLLDRRRPVPAGLVAGLAAVLKQTAWPLLPFLIVAARDRDGRRAMGRTLATVAAVVAAVLGPFLLWNPSAFVEDVVLFPFGLAKQPTLAASPTLGSVLAALAPGAKGAIAVASMLVVLGVAAYLLVLRPPSNGRDVAERAAVVVFLAIVLATAGRFGYLLYPIGLVAWARLVLGPDSLIRLPETLSVSAEALRFHSPGGCPSGQRERSVKSPA